MPGFLESIRKIAGVLETLKIDYMLLGALALPYYGRIRATEDVDMALCPDVALHPELLEKLNNELKQRQVEIVTPLSGTTPVLAWTDFENKVEGEFWLEPDGVPMQKEILDRRIRRRFDNFELWIIGPEDFIVNKLARPDRTPLDEDDVLSVLKKSGSTLDMDYLDRRAGESGVSGLLHSLQQKI